MRKWTREALAHWPRQRTPTALKVWLIIAFVALLVAQHWLATLASTVHETQTRVVVLHEELKALRDDIQRLSKVVMSASSCTGTPGACGGENC